MTIDDDDLNVVLDDEVMKAIAALTVEDIAAIDEAIVSKLRGHWQKTAFVIALSMYAYPDRYGDFPDVFYDPITVTPQIAAVSDTQHACDGVPVRVVLLQIEGIPQIRALIRHGMGVEQGDPTIVPMLVRPALPWRPPPASGHRNTDP